MIIMPILMVSPVLALLLFYYLPFETALPIYGIILIISGFCYYIMFKSMRMKAKIGMETRIGKEALVIEDIDPEGKVQIDSEIWDATGRGRRFRKGERVRVCGYEGLMLVVEPLRIS